MGGTGSRTCHLMDPLLDWPVAFASSHLHQMSTFWTIQNYLTRFKLWCGVSPIDLLPVTWPWLSTESQHGYPVISYSGQVLYLSQCVSMMWSYCLIGVNMEYILWVWNKNNYCYFCRVMTNKPFTLFDCNWSQ